MESIKMKPDQERVHNLLVDTVTLLCKNGLHFEKGIVIQGVIGVTIDDHEVFIVHINKEFSNSVPDTVPDPSTGENQEMSMAAISYPPASKKRARSSSNQDQSQLMDSSSTSHFQNIHMSPTSYYPPNVHGNDPAPDTFKNEFEGMLGTTTTSSSSSAGIKNEPGDDEEIIFVKSEVTGTHGDWQKQFNQQEIDSSTNNDWDGQYKKRIDVLQNVGSGEGNPFDLNPYQIDSQHVSLNSADSTFVGNEFGSSTCQQTFPFSVTPDKQQAFPPPQNLPRKVEQSFPGSSTFQPGSPDGFDIKPNFDWCIPSKPWPSTKRGAPRPKRGRGSRTSSSPAPSNFSQEVPQESWEAMVTTNFVCKMCGNSFTHKSNLLGHQVRVHGRQKNKRGRPPAPATQPSDQSYSEQW